MRTSWLCQTRWRQCWEREGYSFWRAKATDCHESCFGHAILRSWSWMIPLSAVDAKTGAPNHRKHEAGTQGENNHHHSPPPISDRSCGFDSGNGEWTDQGARKSRGINGSKGWYYEIYQAQQLSEEMEGKLNETSEAHVMKRLLTYMWRYKMVNSPSLSLYLPN